VCKDVYFRDDSRKFCTSKSKQLTLPVFRYLLCFVSRTWCPVLCIKRHVYGLSVPVTTELCLPVCITSSTHTSLRPHYFKSRSRELYVLFQCYYAYLESMS
jgi:hypothetical protein